MNRYIHTPFTSKEMEEIFALQQLENRLKREVDKMKMYKITFYKEVKQGILEIVGFQYVRYLKQAQTIVKDFNLKQGFHADFVERNIEESKEEK